MLRPAFRSARLAFGCHDGPCEFPDVRRPIVIAGPNGSGKSTLVEGLVRTLFGFERRRGAEAAGFEARRPWRADAMSGEVTLRVGDELYRISRDFATDRVRVDSPADGIEYFHGDGNPGAANREARQYRGILTDLLGIGDLDTYERTLFIRQGSLPETSLGDHLLRLAAGGHARVDAARRDVAEAHRGVTRRPIHVSARPAVNPRELEKLEEEIVALRSRLDSAREAGERRGPLALERDRVAGRLEAVDEDIRRLEDARSALARTQAIEVQARQLRDLGRKLDRARAELLRHADELGVARAARRDAERAGPYPADFAERLARLDVRWAEQQALRRRPPSWLLLPVALVAVAAGTLLTIDQLGAATAAGAVALLGLVGWLAVRLDSRRRLAAVRAEIATELGDVPHAEALSPVTRQRHAARFNAQRAAAARVAAGRWALAHRMREARGLLRDAGELGIPRPAPEEDGAGGGASAADRLARRVAAAGSAVRDRMARERFEIDRVGEASLSLPDGVPPTEQGVADALRERRTERYRLQRTLQDIGQALLERGTPAESAAALEAALAEMLPRRDALLRKAEALEAAHALIRDAYDAFREHDQERLVGHVSRHVQRLTGGRAGPVLAPAVLEDARVRVEGRVVPLESPPLSFGEYHALLLGVRVGAGDFLGGVGILPPLIIDEPFAHFDLDHARAAWELLGAVARERQVILTTQDALLLDALEITADLQLGPGLAAAAHVTS